MTKILDQFNTELPLPDIFPKAFHKVFLSQDYFSFRNLPHFCHTVSKLTQKKDNMCNISYAEALRKLLAGESDFPESEQKSIRNLVRQNLHKRGLITEEVYEAYRYTVDGTNVGVDIGKYANGESDCVISPSKQYIDFFYELYVNISYPWTIKNKPIRQHCAKLLSTIEELERQHIFIKISLIFPAKNCGMDGSHFFSSIPLFSHKDVKSINTMSAVINDRLLRKFYFAILEEYYGDNLVSGYGTPIRLKGSMNIGDSFDEVKFFKSVQKDVGIES